MIFGLFLSYHVCQKIVVLHKWLLPVITCKLDASQFAYVSRPGTGTTSALTLFVHKLSRFLDNKSGAVRILSVDFAKAFDKIPHSVIIDACVQFKLPLQLTLWLKSFLSELQRVHIDGRVSIDGLQS